MKRFVCFRNSLLAVVAICGLLFATTAHTQEVKAEPVKAVVVKPLAEKDVPQYLQDIAVTIRAEGHNGPTAEGSGVFKVTKDGQVWIWTCGHLVEHLRTTRKTPDGKTIVEFSDARIIKVLNEDGRKVAELSFDAQVVRYSDAEYGEDLALLRLRSKKYKPAASAIFYLDKEIPPIGTKLMHCGSLLGQMGSNSVTNGIVSQLGRLRNHTVYDQTNATSFPGSSGGVVCLEKDGRYVGMIVRGAGETFSLYVPIRRMMTWAKKVGVEFAINDSLPIPADTELFKKPIDDDVRPSKDEPPLAGAKEANPTKLFYIPKAPRPLFGIVLPTDIERR